jgi:hypothetical protein
MRVRTVSVLFSAKGIIWNSIAIFLRYALSIKKNEFTLFAGKWVKIIMLSEISQPHKYMYCMFSLICDSRVEKS